MSDNEVLIQEIQQIRQQYQAEVGSSGRKVWPKSIRERILILDQGKLGAKKIAALTNIPYETILQWRYNNNSKMKKSFHVLAVQKSLLAPVRNATVTVAAMKSETDPSKNAPADENATVTVTMPTGYQISGATSAVLAILKTLGKQL